MIAFLSLGWEEMFLLFLIGLLLYGRNLPEAGRNLGRVVAQLKRSFQDFKDQLDREGEIRDVKKAIQDTAREVKNVAKVPRAMANPGGALRELAHDAMSGSPSDQRPQPGEHHAQPDEQPRPDEAEHDAHPDQQERHANEHREHPEAASDPAGGDAHEGSPAGGRKPGGA